MIDFVRLENLLGKCFAGLADVASNHLFAVLHAKKITASAI